MQFTALITDDDAVSPVIGVILMVAITVILAAVTGAFVLGIGQQSNNTPDASFTFEYERVDENTSPDARDWGYVRITHNGGDAINRERLYIRGTGFNSSGQCDGSFANAEDWASTPNTSGNRCNLGTPMNQYTDEEVHRSTPGQWPADQVQADGDESKVVSGTFARVYVSGGYELSVDYESADGQTSATIAEDTGPNA